MLLKKFLSDSLWLSLGKFGTTLISFFLVPLYTYYLTPEEYGLVDLILTTSVLLIPIITCQTADALQTFLLRKELDSTIAFTNSTVVFLGAWLLSLLIFPLISSIFHEYTISLYIIILFQGFSHLAFGLNRGLDRIKLSSIVSVFESVTLLTLMVLCLAYFKLGMEGFIFALVGSKIVGTLFYIWMTPISRFLAIKSISVDAIKILLVFSLPLVPNMVGWWINNASDRYMINFFLGLEANGLYAVGSKIPSILNIISTILVSSWHISALQNYEKKNTPFFKKANTLFAYLFILSALLIILFKDLIFSVFVTSVSFGEAIDIVPLLTLGAALSAMSSVLGVIYLGEKKTKQAAYTTLVGGALNIILNYFLIPRYGLIGAAWGTVISFFVVLAIRYFHARKVTSIRIPYPVLAIFILASVTLFADALGIVSDALFLIGVFALIMVMAAFLYIFIIKTKILKELNLWKRKS